MATFADLTTDVSDFLDRSDITAKISLFTRLAQASLERNWLPKFLGQTVTIPIVGNQFLVPNNSLGIKRVWLYTGSTITKLSRKDELFVRINTGSTKYYWREDSDCFLHTAPAVGSSIRMRYIAKGSLLALAADTNKWTLNAYDALFWAVVLQAALFLTDEGNIAIAKGMLDGIMQDMELFEIMENHTDLESAPGDYYD